MGNCGSTQLPVNVLGSLCFAEREMGTYYHLEAKMITTSGLIIESDNFDQEHGYHITRFTGKPVPTFLGSMLDGQRAMDRYSRQRLQRHIKRALAGS